MQPQRVLDRQYHPESQTTSRLDSYATLTNSTEESGSVILDYGVAVAGIPVLHIHGLDTPSNKALIDFTVSEGYPGITKSEGDGPYPFSAGADTSLRVRFRVSGPGFYEAKCVQGLALSNWRLGTVRNH